ncbi:Hypothetical predicted protein [Pelobates cultripes]|uniref:Uncharacterized protein n=1 Tax=Pelobates cultripes TaxID=61616 RepID=A0AAD1WVS7_PELCU|nr:Hypothetical predicted protein [Pelobates cultripes]
MIQPFLGNKESDTERGSSENQWSDLTVITAEHLAKCFEAQLVKMKAEITFSSSDIKSDLAKIGERLMAMEEKTDIISLQTQTKHWKVENIRRNITGKFA